MNSLPLLADISADNLPQVGNWLQILFFIVCGALAVVKLISHFQTSPAMKLPTPLEVRQSTAHVPRHEFEALKSEVHEIRNGMADLKNRLHQVHTDLLIKGEERAEHIHNRINDVLAAIKINRPNGR